MFADRTIALLPETRYLAALIGFFAVVAPCRTRARGTQTAASVAPSKSTSYRNTSPGIAYVGSNVCAGCHAEIYSRYTGTDMGRSMSLASDEAQRSVPGQVTIQDAKLNRFFQVLRRGSDLYQAEYELAPDGSEVFRTAEKLQYAIGSGANGTGYIVKRGDYLFEAPLSYYSKSKSWGLSPGYEFGDYGFSRAIPAECLACHSGMAQPVPHREGLYRNPPFRELAIGCENCHGPGQLHVQERMKTTPIAGGIDTAIVNPAKLPGWLADNICMNCHQGGDMKVPRPGKDYFDFRPGTPLQDTAAIFALPIRRESPPSSPLLQHYWSMILSRCYRSSGGRMSCISCHDPHIQPASDATSYYRRRCLSCHAEQSCSLPLALRKGKNPSDDCAGCHMPKQNLAEIAHSALTNHRIVAREDEPYPEIAFHETTPELPDLVLLNAVPGAKEATPPLALLQVYGGLLNSHPEYRQHYVTLLHRLAQSDRDNPIVLSGLAWEKLSEGKPEGREEAIRYLFLAIKAGSTAATDYETLVDILTRAGRTSEAIAVAGRGLELNPYDQRLYKSKAFLHITAREYAEALRAMKKELELFSQDDLMRGLIRKAEAAQAGH
jgi:hypothetical protein